MRMRRIILSSEVIFPHYLINGMILGEKGSKHKMCIDFLYNFCLKRFSFYVEFSEIWYDHKYA